MITFQELKRNTKKDNSVFPTRKVALLGDTAKLTDYVAKKIKMN